MSTDPLAILSGLRLDARWTKAARAAAQPCLSPVDALPHERRALLRDREQRMHDLGLDVARPPPPAAVALYGRVGARRSTAVSLLHSHAASSRLPGSWRSATSVVAEIAGRLAIQRALRCAAEAGPGGPPPVAISASEAERLPLATAAASMARPAGPARRTVRGSHVSSVAWQVAFLSGACAEVSIAARPSHADGAANGAAEGGAADEAVAVGSRAARVLVVGSGAVGQAVVRCAIGAGLLGPSDVLIATPRPDRPELAPLLGGAVRAVRAPRTPAGAASSAVRGEGRLAALAAGCRVVVLACPWEALPAVGKWLLPACAGRSAVISAVAGFSAAAVASALCSEAPDAPVCPVLVAWAPPRGVMPQAAVDAGATAVADALAALWDASAAEGAAARDQAARAAAELAAELSGSAAPKAGAGGGGAARGAGGAGGSSAAARPGGGEAEEARQDAVRWTAAVAALGRLRELHRPSAEAFRAAAQKLVPGVEAEVADAVAALAARATAHATGMQVFAKRLGATDALWATLGQARVLGVGSALASAKALAASALAVLRQGTVATDATALAELEARAQTHPSELETLPVGLSLLESVGKLAPEFDTHNPDSRISAGLGVTLRPGAGGRVFLAPESRPHRE